MFRKSRAGISLITTDHLYLTIGGLFRRWMMEAGINEGGLRVMIRENRFILYKYQMEAAKFDPSTGGSEDKRSLLGKTGGPNVGPGLENNL